MATPLVLRVTEVNARVYRRTWRGSVITTFLNPVLFLTAMGIGLGSLVDRGTGEAALEGFTYLAFLAPGLLAATAMQTGAGDSAWPVMAGIKWVRTWHATLTTPVGISHLAIGHLLWIAIRLTFVCVVYAVVMMLFGAVGAARGLAAVAPAVLTGLAFAAPITAMTARLENEQGLSSMFRFGIVPMFLFSGTFFPISQLPDWMEPVALATPLYHGVELTRALALGVGTASPPSLHVGYLAALVAAGAWLSTRTLGDRLLP